MVFNSPSLSLATKALPLNKQREKQTKTLLSQVTQWAGVGTVHTLLLKSRPCDLQTDTRVRTKRSAFLVPSHCCHTSHFPRRQPSSLLPLTPDGLGLA